MKIKKISETELIITKNAWRARLVGLLMSCVLLFLPNIYNMTSGYLPKGEEGYSVVTAALLGLIGIGLLLFSHNIKITLHKVGAVEIRRRTLVGKAKTQSIASDSILSIETVVGRSTDLLFIMKDNSPAIRFFSQGNSTLLGIGGGSDLANESHQIADFLEVPFRTKGTVINSDLAKQAAGIATEVLRPDTVKMAADREDEWERRELGENSAHQQLANREIRQEILAKVLPRPPQSTSTTGEVSSGSTPPSQPNVPTQDVIERIITKV